MLNSSGKASKLVKLLYFKKRKGNVLVIDLDTCLEFCLFYHPGFLMARYGKGGGDLFGIIFMVSWVFSTM